MESIKQRAYNLVRLGVLCGGIFAVWVCILMIAQHSFTIVVRDEPVSGPLTVVAYIAGGAGAGLVVALLYPMQKWFVGSVLLGIIAVVPFAAALQIAISGFTMTRIDLISSVIFCIALGGILGPSFRSLFYDSGTNRSKRSARAP